MTAKILYNSTICATITVFLFSLVFYVFCVNQLTSGSYSVKGYEKEIAKLQDENAKLQMNFAQAGFLEDMQQKAQALNFQKINSISYIQVLDLSLAKK